MSETIPSKIFNRIDTIIRDKPETVGFITLLVGFALSYILPGRIGVSVAAALFFTGFAYCVFAYRKALAAGQRRLLVTLGAACLAASIGTEYVTW